MFSAFAKAGISVQENSTGVMNVKDRISDSVETQGDNMGSMGDGSSWLKEATKSLTGCRYLSHLLAFRKLGVSDEQNKRSSMQSTKLGISTLSRLMDDCLPKDLESEQDFQKLIDKLWPALVCEFEVD